MHHRQTKDPSAELRKAWEEERRKRNDSLSDPDCFCEFSVDGDINADDDADCIFD